MEQKLKEILAKAVDPLLLPSSMLAMLVISQD